MEIGGLVEKIVTFIAGGVIGGVITGIFTWIARSWAERPALEWNEKPREDKHGLAYGDLVVRNHANRSLLVERLSINHAHLVLHLWRGIYENEATGSTVEVNEMLSPHGEPSASCTLNLSVRLAPDGTSSGGSKINSLPRTCTIVVRGIWTTALPLLFFRSRALKRRLKIAMHPSD